MNVQKYFEEVFNAKCIITEHAMKRLNARFMASEISQLKLLAQAGLKNTPLTQWEEQAYTVFIDSRVNFSMVCVYHKEENIVKIITFVRGKQETAYKDCTTISVSISKEKAQQEVMQLNKSSHYKKK